MRFVLNHSRNFSPDGRIQVGLGNALREAGHEIFVSGGPADTRSPDTYRGMDVAIEINQPRDDVVPPGVVHIDWIQDYPLGKDEPSPDDCCLDHDLIYTFGYGPLIGVPTHGWKHYAGSLLTAADEALLEMPPAPQTTDFSIVGFIPPPYGDPWWLSDVGPDPLSRSINAEIFQRMKAAVEKHYAPIVLAGSLDPVGMMARIREALDEMVYERFPGRPDKADMLWKHVSWPAGKFMHEYTRMMDRHALAELALEISDDTEFWGLNWEKYSYFAPWAKGVADDTVSGHRRTKINLHNNIFGFALHTRVFEVLATGGFILTHSAPYPKAAGRISETFVPNVHYGEFTTRASFADVAWVWLDNDEARLKAGAEARKVIRDKHLWKHRVAQILRDLGVRQTVAA